MTGNDLSASIFERPAHAPAFFLAPAVIARRFNSKRQGFTTDRGLRLSSDVLLNCQLRARANTSRRASAWRQEFV
jgi:hypothetical protein